MLEILTAPNPILLQKAKPIGRIDSSIIRLIEEMEQTLKATKDPEGVGLAAPQVGRSLQIFIIKPTKKLTMQVFINPIVQGINEREGRQDTEHTTKTGQEKLEGCLSLPTIWGEVKREPSIMVSYIDEKGKKRTRTYKGFVATIIQHEYDHLQGTLFTKRVLEQKGTLYKSHKDKNGKDVFEEIEI